MAKARASRKGPRSSGEGNGKSQRAGRAGSAKAKAAPAKSKASRAVARPPVAKAQAARPRVEKAGAAVVVRAEAVRARRPAQMAPIVSVIPETPPPLPAPIASFTF